MLVDLDHDRGHHLVRGLPRHDVCVVGAGPVGLAMAAELLDRGLSVVVAESGDVLPRARRARLAAGDVVGDDRFGPLEIKVHRAVGGTSWLWMNDLPGGRQGVRHTVIDPDVIARHRPDGRDWPVDPARLDSLLGRALVRVGLPGVDVSDLEPVPSARVGGLDEGRYVFGERSVFQATGRNRTGLGRTVVERATVVVGATVVALLPRGPGRTDAVDHVVVTSPTGRQATIRATTFVLAAGTVENTRIAWMLGGSLDGVRANRMIGVGVMDRPRVAGTLELTAEPAAWMSEFGVHDEGGIAMMQRWLAPAGGVRAGAPSCAFLPSPGIATPGTDGGDVGRGAARRRAERFARQALMTWPTVFEQRIADNSPAPVARALLATNQHTYGLRSWAYRHLLRDGWDLEWSRWPDTPRSWRNRHDWSMTAIVEQFPDGRNRLELGTGRDIHGRPVPRLVWGRPIERSGAVARTLEHASTAFAVAGIGRLDWPGEGFAAVSSCHLMGSLAMGDDPAISATDTSGRLRGAANVIVAGSCLFPTGGHSNPTLTALALAIGSADSIAGSRRPIVSAPGADGLDHTDRRPVADDARIGVSPVE